MNQLSRIALVAFSLTVSAGAFAQAAPSKAGASNPVGRGDNVFYYAPLNTSERGGSMSNPLDNAGIGRPTPRSGVQVTPVPEPSQWAMMLAGLALVGFIVRRSNSQRP